MSVKALFAQLTQLIVSPPASAQAQAQIRVLVVEDEAARHDRWIEKLYQSDIDVELVSSERQARRRIQDETFDILILNWNLYQGTGRIILETWIDRQQGDEPSVVFSTNPTDDDLMTQALKIGAHNVLKKNGDDELFARLVARYIRHVRREKALNTLMTEVGQVRQDLYKVKLALAGAGFTVAILFVPAMIAFPDVIKAVL